MEKILHIAFFDPDDDFGKQKLLGKLKSLQKHMHLAYMRFSERDAEIQTATSLTKPKIQNLGNQKLDEKDYKSEDSLYIFVAPEYLFMPAVTERKLYAKSLERYTKEEKKIILEQMIRFSKEHPKMLIVLGTIPYIKNLEENHPLYKNRALLIKNGEFASYSKRIEKELGYKPQTAHFKPGKKSGEFQIDGLKACIKICADITEPQQSKDSGPYDLQFILSRSISHKPGELEIRPGGLLIHADANWQSSRYRMNGVFDYLGNAFEETVDQEPLDNANSNKEEELSDDDLISFDSYSPKEPTFGVLHFYENLLLEYTPQSSLGTSRTLFFSKPGSIKESFKPPKPG